MNNMNIELVIGFAAVSGSGVAVWYRGRITAAVGLGVVLLVAVVISALSSGREAVSDLMVGSLVGLPVLLASILATNRREHRRIHDPHLNGGSGRV